jgi:hypothetical protein
MFFRPISRWDLSPRLVNDHDFRSDSTGVAIPYGIYDLLANRGSVMVGVSHDTSAFAAHAIAHWWRQEGSLRYPRSRQLLILSDTGGSNGARRRTWKTELQSQLADSLGLTLTVAHYPTGASKWNPIEHRLFSEISKNWAGAPLDSYQKILNFIRSTRTDTGLSVTAQLDRRNYPTGTEPTPEQLRPLAERGGRKSRARSHIRAGPRRGVSIGRRRTASRAPCTFPTSSLPEPDLGAVGHALGGRRAISNPKRGAVLSPNPGQADMPSDSV